MRCQDPGYGSIYAGAPGGSNTEQEYESLYSIIYMSLQTWVDKVPIMSMEGLCNITYASVSVTRIWLDLNYQGPLGCPYPLGCGPAMGVHLKHSTDAVLRVLTDRVPASPGELNLTREQWRRHDHRAGRTVHCHGGHITATFDTGFKVVKESRSRHTTM